MRIAYYIAVHRSIEQFRWIFSAIYNDNDVYAINVDRKAGNELLRQVHQEVEGRHNISLISNHSVAWSGWSFCMSELAALKHLLSANASWSYYVNLSAQCYPIKPIEIIRESLEKAWPHNFVKAAPFSEIAKIEPSDTHLSLPLFFEFKGKIRFARLHWPQNQGISWKGSTWHVLSRPFCRWIFESGALSSIPLCMKYTFCPDELLFQNLIMNSPFRDTIAKQKAREVIWPGPKILTMEDWPTISNSSAFFARKFDLQKDQKVLQKLAEQNRLSIPVHAAH